MLPRGSFRCATDVNYFVYTGAGAVPNFQFRPTFRTLLFSLMLAKTVVPSNAANCTVRVPKPYQSYSMKPVRLLVKAYSPPRPTVQPLRVSLPVAKVPKG